MEHNVNSDYADAMATLRIGNQLSFFAHSEIDAAVHEMANANADGRGAIFTRREVVDFILDLSGYTADQRLSDTRLLEPSMGEGDFLLPAIERLLDSHFARGDSSDIVQELGDCVTAVELHKASYEHAQKLVIETLTRRGIQLAQARALTARWLLQGDFLLLDHSRSFTHVIGNPPYIRQELIPDVLMAEYRRRYTTIYDRADIYVPFIEQSLSLLAPRGCVAFICSDRWIKNRYGGPLRKLIAEKHHLRYFVDMVDTPAFHSDVIAYPAIFVIGQEKGGQTKVAARPPVESEALLSLSRELKSSSATQSERVSEIHLPGTSDQPWMLEASEELSLIRRIETEFPTLDEAGCKVGIGVATGADKVFIGNFDALDVEPDRKLPLVMTKDISSGIMNWRGMGVINPFGADGKLVSLSSYPKLKAYLEKNGDEIRARHVSKKNPDGWFRTIDRIYPELANKPKLLIPDIKGEANIVYEAGQFYPHHNLYFVTSEEWDLLALQAVLLSAVTRLFISSYSTKMRGGYLRFQAQYLRRLRIPRWNNVSEAIKLELNSAGRSRDPKACNLAIAKLYRLTGAEIKILGIRGIEQDAA